MYVVSKYHGAFWRNTGPAIVPILLISGVVLGGYCPATPQASHGIWYTLRYGLPGLWDSLQK